MKTSCGVKKTEDPKQTNKMGQCRCSSSSQGSSPPLPDGHTLLSWAGRHSYLSLLSLLSVPGAHGVLVGPSDQGHLKE